MLREKENRKTLGWGGVLLQNMNRVWDLCDMGVFLTSEGQAILVLVLV